MKSLNVFWLIWVVVIWSCGGIATSDNASNGNIEQEKDTIIEKEVVSSEEVIEEEITEDVEEQIEEETKRDKGNKKKEATKEKISQKKSSSASRSAAPSKTLSLKTSTDDFSKEYLMGKFNPNTHPDFTEIKSKHASRGGMKLRKDTYEAFQQMYDAALKDGVRLKIISATRPFEHQKRIWEAKWTGKRKVNGKLLSGKPKVPKQRALLILMYSSMPGTSRHHWGTDIDLNDLNNPYFERGQGKKIYDWLVANASAYGFCQVYSPLGDKRDNGYQEEKWHWSYVPVARRLTNLYKEKLTNADISGFEGAETAQSIDMINNYVLGINPDCK